jgi:chromosome segregation ATPase
MFVARDQTVRHRIVGYLKEHGPVSDSSGRATSALKAAVGYEGSDTAFTQLVSAMAKSGALTRDVKGKRTYSVSLDGNQRHARVQLEAEEDTEQTLMDYEELAASLLARVTRILAASSDSSESTSWARRRLEQLETRNTALQREVARAKADLEAVMLERDALKRQLDVAQHNTELLTERLNVPRKTEGKAAERLGTDEQTLLYQLRGRQRPSAASPSPERVS